MSLEADFRSSPKDFANKNALLPADAASGYSPKNENDITTTKFSGFRHTVVDQSQHIASISLVKEISRDRGEVVKVQPSLTTTTGIPAYFLPWDSRGAAVELTIPNDDPGKAETAHPRFFFTAVLSGCSIMFKGSQQNPTIYHCGTAGGSAGTPTTGDSNQFFLDMLNDCHTKGLGTLGPVLSQVRSDQYMVPRLGSANVSQLEKDVSAAMQSLYKSRIQMVATIAWGAVFGFRAQGSRDWKFYMQQNTSIQYYEMDEVLDTVVKKKFMGLVKTQKQVKSRRQGRFHNYARPIQLTRVFPGGGVAKATSTWKTIKGA